MAPDRGSTPSESLPPQRPSPCDIRLTLLRTPCSHYDFIGLECFSGFADKVYAYLEIQGLEVADVERIGPNEDCNPRTLTEWV